MLFMFVQRGCPACSAAKPEFEKFKGRNPLALALELDADGPYPAHLGVGRIRATPFYVYKVEGTNEAVTHEGTMKAEQIEKWVKAAEAAYA